MTFFLKDARKYINGRYVYKIKKIPMISHLFGIHKCKNKKCNHSKMYIVAFHKGREIHRCETCRWAYKRIEKGDYDEELIICDIKKQKKLSDVLKKGD